MIAPYVCPPFHSHGNAQGCYTKHGCRCDACKAKASAESKRRKAEKRNREMGAARFREVPYAPISPCVGEDAALVRRMIARHAPAAEVRELEAMLGVAA
ncbi:hypothetical protein [Microbacterium xylanilyticum]